ncbi:hypothetical protein [Devosia sp. CAU 1758]
MDRVYTFLLTLGVPQAVVAWLARRRLLVIGVLAILAWLPVIGIIWLFMLLLG